MINKKQIFRSLKYTGDNIKNNNLDELTKNVGK